MTVEDLTYNKLIDKDIGIKIPKKYKNNDNRTFNPLKDKINIVRDEIIKLDSEYEVEKVIKLLIKNNYKIYYEHLYNNNGLQHALKFFHRDMVLYIRLQEATRHLGYGETKSINNYCVILNDNTYFMKNPYHEYTFLDLVHGKLESVSDKTIKNIDKLLKPNERYTKKHKDLMEANKGNIHPDVYKTFKKTYKRINNDN